MSFQIAPYRTEHTPAVINFNQRMKLGGAHGSLPENAQPTFTKELGINLFQEHYLALQDDIVRGGYTLRFQDFSFFGQKKTIADIQMPISEGIIDPRYGALGAGLLVDALKREERIFGLGMGGSFERLPKLLKAMGWHIEPIPFFFRIVRLNPFLRNIQPLRTSRFRCVLFDYIARTHAADVPFQLYKTLVRPALKPVDTQLETLTEFGDWVEATWEAASPQYSLVAYRDLKNLRVLYPAALRRFQIARVTRKRELLGWAVLLVTQMKGHKHFGNMKVGTLVDTFGPLVYAKDIVAHATAFLEKQNVDLIVSNQCHHAWKKALLSCGFLKGPSNFSLALSPRLHQEIGAEAVEQIHMTRGDGDGPINL